MILEPIKTLGLKNNKVIKTTNAKMRAVLTTCRVGIIILLAMNSYIFKN